MSKWIMASRYVPSLRARKNGREKLAAIEHGHSGEERMLFKNATHQGKRPGPSTASSAPSILSDDLTIDGDIVSEGEVHINGIVTGDVTARKLTLGEKGAITGTVEVDDAVVAGKLGGRLTAKYVVLLGTARVTAVYHACFVVDCA